MPESEPKRPNRAVRGPRCVALGIGATFAVVLLLAVGLGLALAPFLNHHGPTGFDQHITDWILRQRSRPWNRVMAKTTRLGSGVVVGGVTVLVTVGLVLTRRRRLAAYLAITVIGVALLNGAAKLLVDRRRPPAAVWLQHPHASSFPSGHSAAAAATYVALGMVVLALTRSTTWRALAWTAFVTIVLAVGVSRVYLGVHWTTDVLAGWAVGTLWALGVHHAFGLDYAVAATDDSKLPSP